MPSLNRSQFLEKYVLRVDREFEHDNQSADWATGGPLQWGQENGSMELHHVQNDTKGGRNKAEMGLSPDNKFLAISTNAIIRIYVYETKELRAELVGHLQDVEKLIFAPKEAVIGVTKYLLFSEDFHGSGIDEQILLWDLDGEGRALRKSKGINVHELAGRAVSEISGELNGMPGLLIEDLRSFQGALKVADTKNRARELVSIRGGFPSTKTSSLISSDNNKLLTIERVDKTIAAENKEYDMIIRPLHNPSSELQRLHGHTDRILWASWSPTDPDLLASASCDGTYRVWSIRTGECIHLISPKPEKQAWSGSFSRDEKQVLLADSENVGIYSVQNASKLASLEREDTAHNFARYNAWSPEGDLVAVASGTAIILWEPWTGTQTEILKLEKGDDRLMEGYKRLGQMRWIGQEGARLILKPPGDSYAVWDKEKNLKWRFERPQGTHLESFASGMLYVEEKDTLVTLGVDAR